MSNGSLSSQLVNESLVHAKSGLSTTRHIAAKRNPRMQAHCWNLL